MLAVAAPRSMLMTVGTDTLISAARARIDRPRRSRARRM
jgi:hypothetical protein